MVVNNPQGLHARPADMFVKVASRFASKIDVIKEGEAVDGKSILAILTLAAGEGTELRLMAAGSDAEEAVCALAELFESNFAESGKTE